MRFGRKEKLILNFVGPFKMQEWISETKGIMRFGRKEKQSIKFVGPFKMQEWIGETA